MVKGRRVRAVVACVRNDDCCSPHPKRRGQKITLDRGVLQPNKNNTIEAFFQEVNATLQEKTLDTFNLKSLKDENPTPSDEILLKLMSDNEDVDNDIPKTPIIVREVSQGPPTPHRIEFCPDDGIKPESKIPKATKKRGNQQKEVTDYFPVRRSVRKTKKTVMEEKQRSLEEMLRNEVEDGLEVKIFADKGRGVVTSRPFTKGDFVVEYSGDLIDLNEAKRREVKYAQDKNAGCYMYYFKHNNQQYCVDATAETGKLGRLVNHSRNGNLITRTVSVDNKPRLVLIAKDDIKAGDEITYDYGDRSKESLKYHPWLAY